MNIRQWIDHVSQQLQGADVHCGHGTDNPADEAAWLVMHTVGAALDGTFEDWDREVDETAAACITARLRQRVEQGIPMAYILGSAWFAGLEFEIDEHVLVPRSPIAELIFDQFTPWVEPQQLHRVLDLCTGSGCIGIAIARHMPWLQVDASDISPQALEVAARNLQRHGVADRVSLHRSDLFADLPDQRWDLIVTNPPYVPGAAARELPREYQAEPALGLYSGDDGLDACLQIMLQSPDYLAEQGLLICEVGESEQRLSELFPELPFLWLEFSHGGSGVFLLTREQLLAAGTTIESKLKERQHV